MTSEPYERGLWSLLRTWVGVEWWHWRYRSQQPEDAFTRYIARVELLDWWRDRTYYRIHCGARCNVRYVLGRPFGQHAEDCDDLPF